MELEVGAAEAEAERLRTQLAEVRARGKWQEEAGARRLAAVT
jgi:hypothetical protein